MNINEEIINILYEGEKRIVSYSQIVEILQNYLPKLNIENVKNSTHKWNNPQPIIFAYGDIPDYINPADNMGWDVIIAPNSDPKDSKLRIVGVVKIKDNANKIPPPNGNKPGNHKLILSHLGQISQEEITALKTWFKNTQIFEIPEFFYQGTTVEIEENRKKRNWEKATFGDYPLSHVNDGRWGGIAVGPAAKKSFKRMAESFEKMLIEDVQSQYRIFVDLDGVLCDFPKQFRKLVGEDITPNQYEEKYGKNPFHELIEKEGTKFWSTMEWMPDGKSLWDYVKKYNPALLSAPTRHISSKLGKIEWIKNNLPELTNFDVQTKCKNGWDNKSKIILNPMKYRYVKDHYDILIDDTKDKIDKWNEAGGLAILHTSANDTINKLKELGL